MIKLIEPLWSVNLSKALFAWMQASVFLSHWMPILADIFVFSYPVYLVALYLYGIALTWKRGNVETWKRGMQYKIAAIFIFSGTLLTAIVNILIQFFIDKVRPDIILGVADLKTPSILHKFLPSASFPSDHAAISMGIAFSSIVW
jgi:membrane-associated phospholipid phosphatase